MKAELLDLLHYNTTCNQRIWQHLDPKSIHIPEQVIQLFSHIINAQQIWNKRILNLPATQVWALHPWEVLASMDTNNYQQSMQIVHQSNLDAHIVYQNSKGDSFENSIKDILLHVCNHSTYHRAQMATYLKQNGITPINTDYIFYKRDKMSL